MLTLKQWLAIAGLVVLGFTHWLAYDYGGSEAKADSAVEGRKSAERALDQIAEGHRDAAKANKELRRELGKKPASRVPEIIRANPSNCTVPRPVADELRKAVDQANAAR